MFNNIIIVIFMFSSSLANANYQTQYNKVTVAKNGTLKSFRQIQIYLTGMQDSISYFKANCKIDVSVNNLLPCLSTSAFLRVRLQRIDAVLSQLDEQLQAYPPELSALKLGVLHKVKNATDLVAKNKKGLNDSVLFLEMKSEQAVNEATQKAIVEGSLKGKSLYYCTSFAKKIELFDLDYQILKGKSAGFSSYYQKYDEVVKFVAVAELFKADCPDKINFIKANFVADKFSAEITEKNTIAYITAQCKKLKDQDLKKKCHKTGEKKADLLYTLFALEKMGHL